MADEVKRYVAMRSDGLRQDDPAYPPIGPRYVDAKDFDRLARELAAYKQAVREISAQIGDRLPCVIEFDVSERVSELMRENGDG